MSRFQIVVGGQFGSEGKGHVAAQLGAQQEAPLVIRTGGPNAGHTVIGSDGKTYKLRQLPTAVISNPEATVAISAGSLIDPDVLMEEIKTTGIHCGKLLIDPAATVIDAEHRTAELNDESLAGWSTQKGIGAARAARVMRTARTAGQVLSHGAWADKIRIDDVARVATDALRVGRPVLIEAAQGYGLGLHTWWYPKTTSADCRAIDALADVGISPWSQAVRMHPKVWVVLRPYPIRVAGDSGPLYGETTWEQLGLESERTTVTNKVRRVGQFDEALVAQALRANGAPSTNVVVALTMMDQVIPALRGMTQFEELNRLTASEYATLEGWVDTVRRLGSRVEAIGTGPDTMLFMPPVAPVPVWRGDPPVDSAVHRSGE